MSKSTTKTIMIILVTLTLVDIITRLSVNPGGPVVWLRNLTLSMVLIFSIGGSCQNVWRVFLLFAVCLGGSKLLHDYFPKGYSIFTEDDLMSIPIFAMFFGAMLYLEPIRKEINKFILEGDEEKKKEEKTSCEPFM